MQTVKQSVLELMQDLPDDCTWDDLMYRIYVRRQIEAGLRDLDTGERYSHEEVFAEFESQQ